MFRCCLLPFSTRLRAQNIPGSEGFGFANAFVHGGRLWAYGDSLVNRSHGKVATDVHVFSTDDPVSGEGVWRSERVLRTDRPRPPFGALWRPSPPR